MEEVGWAGTASPPPAAQQGCWSCPRGAQRWTHTWPPRDCGLAVGSQRDCDKPSRASPGTSRDLKLKSGVSSCRGSASRRGVSPCWVEGPASLSLAPRGAGSYVWGRLQSTISRLRPIQWPRQTVALNQYRCGSELMRVSKVYSSDTLSQQRDSGVLAAALIELGNGLTRAPPRLRDSLLVWLCCMVHR